jgi:hypothetical protein
LVILVGASDRSDNERVEAELRQRYQSSFVHGVCAGEGLDTSC